MAEFKQFLYAFCGKRKVQPAYTYEEEGTGFYCEVRKSLIQLLLVLSLLPPLHEYNRRLG